MKADSWLSVDYEQDASQQLSEMPASMEERSLQQTSAGDAALDTHLQAEDMEGLKTYAVLNSLYLEQLAIETGGKGETEIPWFFTGLPIPPYHLTEVNKAITAEEPFAGLAHSKWVNANLAYLRDLDFVRKTTKLVRKT